MLLMMMMMVMMMMMMMMMMMLYDAVIYVDVHVDEDEEEEEADDNNDDVVHQKKPSISQMAGFLCSHGGRIASRLPVVRFNLPIIWYYTFLFVCLPSIPSKTHLVSSRRMFFKGLFGWLQFILGHFQGQQLSPMQVSLRSAGLGMKKKTWKMMQNDAGFLRTTAIPSSKMHLLQGLKKWAIFFKNHRCRSLGAQKYGKMMHDSDGCLCPACSSKTSGDKPFQWLHEWHVTRGIKTFLLYTLAI